MGIILDAPQAQITRGQEPDPTVARPGDTGTAARWSACSAVPATWPARVVRVGSFGVQC
jgi:hypothetical protein